jgi:AcrR family transcriptional regulator
MARATKEQSALTAARILDTALEAFAENGYPFVGLEMVAAAAGVTRGAVYHHFNSKAGLFRAVHAEAQRRVGQAVDDATAVVTDPWEALEVGCRAFLEASVRPDIRQIMLIDAPAVLGWDVWRVHDADNSGRLLLAALTELDEAGVLEVVSVPAAHALLTGAMNEAALWIASADFPDRALDDAAQTLRRMMRTLHAASVPY